MKNRKLFILLALSIVSKWSNAQTVISLKPEAEIPMKEFSLLVSVPTTYSNELAKAVSPEWEKTIARWQKEGVYVYSYAFPGEGYIIKGAKKQVRKGVVVANNTRVVSNIILRAEDFQSALKYAAYCPILKHGGVVEVREVPTRSRFPVEQ
ncbi:hypothetical protein RYH73_10070 [Olivibacter sp. CPCC 100613]|uniref:hypothetical protein n=1 Tax=Olivibacter sp. CPCC 100613 TaxID=3079931 RepID=UPI002FF4FDC8